MAAGGCCLLNTRRSVTVGAGLTDPGHPTAESQTMRHWGRGHMSGFRHFHAQTGELQVVSHLDACSRSEHVRKAYASNDFTSN